MSQRNEAGREAPIRVLTLLIAACAGSPAAVSAREAAPVTVNAVEVVEDGVRFSLSLPEGLPAEKVEALDAGERVGVTWELELLRDRKLWFNTTVARSEIESSALFDPITRRYALERRSGKALLETRDAGAREEALAWLEQLSEGLVAVKGERLAKPRIRWRARAVLGRKLVMLFVPATEHTGWARGSLGEAPGGSSEVEELP